MTLDVRAAEPVDADGDGWPVGEDCDDAEDDVFPGAFDQWYDGIDADCDGADDYDRDTDGWQVPQDCADLDPHIFPGAEELQDHVDQDCDGYTDPHYAVAPHGGAACTTVPAAPTFSLLPLLWMVRRRWSR